MQLAGPYTYKIEFNSVRITKVESPDGATNFSGKASSRSPKLYVVSIAQIPIYVGITKQGVGKRFSQGFKAKGNKGYYGYPWRYDSSPSANVDIWLQQKSGDTSNMKDIETVEAEVVFLIRQRTDQWPKYQTEIHFHQSNNAHRAAAQAILNHYE